MYRIAFSGRAKTGKNTAASLLIKNLGLGPEAFKMRAFADPMKQIAKIMFPTANNECLMGESELRSEIIDPKYKDSSGNPLTYRQFLLDLGKFGRQYNSKIWIDCLDHDFKNTDTNLIYIIPDLRFIEEFEYLKENNFFITRIKRKAIQKINDVSEIEQESIPDSYFDFIIDNDRDIDTLYASIHDMIEQIG